MLLPQLNHNSKGLYQKKKICHPVIIFIHHLIKIAFYHMTWQSSIVKQATGIITYAPLLLRPSTTCHRMCSLLIRIAMKSCQIDCFADNAGQVENLYNCQRVSWARNDLVVHVFWPYVPEFQSKVGKIDPHMHSSEEIIFKHVAMVRSEVQCIFLTLSMSAVGVSLCNVISLSLSRFKLCQPLAEHLFHIYLYFLYLK